MGTAGSGADNFGTFLLDTPSVGTGLSRSVTSGVGSVTSDGRPREYSLVRLSSAGDVSESIVSFDVGETDERQLDSEIPSIDADSESSGFRSPVTANIGGAQTICVEPGISRAGWGAAVTLG